MTEQTIPADKVRELIEAYEDGETNYLLDDLRALLPTPQPTSGLFGKWAKHPEHGDVMCIWGKPNSSGHISVHWAKKGGVTDVEGRLVPLDSLTFPHQATKPENVPAGEAWLVNLNGGKHTRVVALKVSHDTWRIGRSDSIVTLWRDEFVELIAPLVPDRPVSDLQAKYAELDKNWCYLDTKYSALRKDYDELEDKYREAVGKIAELKQAIAHIALRYGRGDEQPAWRIEHDAKNLRVGEYIIDTDGDSGVISEIIEHLIYVEGPEDNFTSKYHAPFIVFHNREAATPEAVAEAKKLGTRR